MVSGGGAVSRAVTRATPLENSRVARAAASGTPWRAPGPAGEKRAASRRDARLDALSHGFRQRKFSYLLGLCIFYPILLAILGADDSPVRVAVDILAGLLFIAVLFA